MDKCPCPANDLDLETKLMRKEAYLKLKEEELLKKQRKLQKRETEFQKKRHSKAKADSKAAKKLNQARKKLLLAVDAKDKVEKLQTKRKISKKVKVPLKCVQAQCKWYSKLNGLLENAPNSQPKWSRLCLGNQKIRERCAQYLKKIMYPPYPYEESEVVSSNTPGNKRLKSFHELPCVPKKYTCLDEAAEDCYGMAMGRTPNMWAYHPWPVFYPRHLDFRTQCRNLGMCVVVVASILFWTPCILCLWLCLCCFCSSDC